MEGKKQGGSSSSSFTSELFGPKESSGSSSSGVLESIFGPSSKVLGRESFQSEAVEKKQDYTSQALNTKPGTQDTTPQSNEVGNQRKSSRDMISSFYQEEKVQPCHLSSSIYYGGQDVYSKPENNPNSEHTNFNKDGEEDDSGSASRGNWWQGSLYY